MRSASRLTSTMVRLCCPYYDGATNADRIKYNASGVAAYWWERTPDSGHATSVRRVHTDGTLNSYGAHGAYGLAPACNIG